MKYSLGNLLCGLIGILLGVSLVLWSDTQRSSAECYPQPELARPSAEPNWEAVAREYQRQQAERGALPCLAAKNSRAPLPSPLLIHEMP